MASTKAMQAIAGAKHDTSSRTNTPNWRRLRIAEIRVRLKAIRGHWPQLSEVLKRSNKGFLHYRACFRKVGIWQVIGSLTASAFNITHVEAHDDELRKFEASGATPLKVTDDLGYIENDGARIWYGTYGAGAPVILLHGGLGQSGIGDTRSQL
jgi:hypothetical protein